jgi:uncharacterized protein (TIGR02246 family)
MRKWISFSLFSAAFLFSACTEPGEDAMTRGTGETSQQDMTSIEDVRNQYMEAYQAGDSARLADLFADDAVVAPASPGEEPMTGRDAIRSGMERELGMFTIDEMNIDSEETKVFGEWAMDRGTYTIRMSPKTAAGTEAGTGTAGGATTTPSTGATGTTTTPGTTTMPAGPHQMEGHYMVLLHREADGWKISRLISNVTNQPAMEGQIAPEKEG